MQSDIRELVLGKVETMLSKPRTSAYTPQALVEIIYALLSLAYNETKFQKYMFKEFGSSARPWWLEESLDYPTATARLKHLVEVLKENNFEQ